MTKPESYFKNPQIEREYLYWRDKIGADKPSSEFADASLSVDDVLRAYFLIVQFFSDREGKFNKFGMSDKTGNLLHSAVERQFTGFGNERKWTQDYDIAATLLFGLIKNHPFIDGNKRTAYLSVLYFLDKRGYAMNTAGNSALEKFTVAIASGRYRRDHLYQYFRGVDKMPDDDAAVSYISFRLGMMFHAVEGKPHSLHQLMRIFQSKAGAGERAMLKSGIGENTPIPMKSMTLLILAHAASLLWLARK